MEKASGVRDATVCVVNTANLYASLSALGGLEGWHQPSRLAQHLQSPTGFEGWTPVFAVPASEASAPSTPPALLQAVRAEKLLAQLQVVHKAYLVKKLGPGPVVVVPPWSEAFVRHLQLLEATAREALLPQVGQAGFEARYASAIAEYSNLVGIDWASRIDWLDYTDSDLE